MTKEFKRVFKKKKYESRDRREKYTRGSEWGFDFGFKREERGRPILEDLASGFEFSSKEERRVLLSLRTRGEP